MTMLHGVVEWRKAIGNAEKAIGNDRPETTS
jgi:hypothetical protein